MRSYTWHTFVLKVYGRLHPCSVAAVMAQLGLGSGDRSKRRSHGEIFAHEIVYKNIEKFLTYAIYVVYRCRLADLSALEIMVTSLDMKR